MQDRDALLHIRLANIDEVPTLSSLVQEAYIPWSGTVGRRPRPMDDNYDERCNKGQAWLAEHDSQLIGVLITEEFPDYLFLHNVAVAPAHQHRGFGRELMQFVEEQGRRRGYGQVRLTTSEVMTRNVALYTGLGYVITDRETTTTADRLWMSKSLS